MFSKKGPAIKYFLKYEDFNQPNFIILYELQLSVELIKKIRNNKHYLAQHMHILTIVGMSLAYFINIVTTSSNLFLASSTKLVCTTD